MGKQALNIVKSREFGIGIILVLAIGLTAFLNPRFVTGSGFSDLLLSSAIFGALAVGLAPVVVARHIDLSIASNTGLSAYITAKLISDHQLGVIPAFIIGGAFGLIIGSINGVIVAGLRLPSLVVTLGMLFVVRGIDYQIAGGQKITAQQLPRSILDLGIDNFMGVPIVFWVVLVLTLFTAWWMKYTALGRSLYAIGSNPPTADVVGINVFRSTFFAFAFSGFMAGIGGVIYVARFAQVDSSAFINQELAVVTAVVVGGVNIFGGVGTAIGALLGALLVRTIIGALVALGVPAFWQQAVNGALLLVAIGLDRFLATRGESKAERVNEEREEEQSWRG